MSKKKGEGLKSFNKGFSVPDTYIIIFFVVVLAAIVTFFVPKGYYETQDVTYMMNGVEKTRTVIKDGSFQYLTDDAGKAVTEGVTLFSGIFLCKYGRFYCSEKNPGLYSKHDRAGRWKIRIPGSGQCGDNQCFRIHEHGGILCSCSRCRLSCIQCHY